MENFPRGQHGAHSLILNILKGENGSGVGFLAPEFPGTLHGFRKGRALVFRNAERGAVRVTLGLEASAHDVQGQSVNGGNGMTVVGKQRFRPLHGLEKTKLLLVAVQAARMPVAHGAFPASGGIPYIGNTAGGRRHAHSGEHTLCARPGRDPGNHAVEHIHGDLHQ